MFFRDHVVPFLEQLWQKHPGKCACSMAGMLLGVCIVVFGFWNMFFILLMGAVGLFIGMNIDREGDTWQNIKDYIPRDIHRLR